MVCSLAMSLVDGSAASVSSGARQQHRWIKDIESRSHACIHAFTRCSAGDMPVTSKDEKASGEIHARDQQDEAGPPRPSLTMVPTHCRWCPSRAT